MSALASRRGILAASAAALMAPAMAPIADAVAAGASEAEARLLALRLAALQAFDAHGASVTLFNRADEAGDDEAAAIHDEQADAAWDAREAALFAMAEIPASSLAGLAAKADFAHPAASQGASAAELELMRSLAADTARVLGDRVPPPAAACPDAELVSACGAYAEAMQRFNDQGGRLEPDMCPLWRVVDAARNRALAAPPPRSLAGVRAKAELCRTMAQSEADGRFDYSDSYCGDWPGQVVEDVLRLMPRGGAA